MVPEGSGETLQFGEDDNTIVKETYTYTNHGFSIELPKGFVPIENESEGGPAVSISMPKSGDSIDYITNADFWEKHNLSSIEEGNFCKKGTVIIGNKTFKVCKDNYSDNLEFYWLRVGSIGYELHGNKKSFESFKFVGWPQIEGNKNDLVSFSIKPGQEVSGKVHASGLLSGGYFFEGNLPVAILDSNKNATNYGPGHGTASTDWMTSGPVSFYIDFDFSNTPSGSYYIRLTQDDPSDHANGFVPASILIPIVVK